MSIARPTTSTSQASSELSRRSRLGRLTPKAVIPVDLFGLPADYPAIRDVAARTGLRVLADAAQSFGASCHGVPVGSLADVTATSFFPAKPLGCYGDGGAVFTDDDDLAALMRSIRVHGKGNDKYDTIRVGVNSRLDTLQAAVLLAKLTVFDAEIESRQRIAADYLRELGSLVGLGLPHPIPPHGHSSPSGWRLAHRHATDSHDCSGRMAFRPRSITRAPSTISPPTSASHHRPSPFRRCRRASPRTF